MNIKKDKSTENSLESYYNELSNFPLILKRAMNGASVKGYAAETGISEGSLRNLLDGGMPRLDTLIAIAKHSNLTLDQLTLNTSAKEGESDYAFITKMDIEVSAGHGSQTPEYEVVSRKMAFRRDWLASRGLGG